MTTTPNPYRLPRTVVPSAYRLALRPDLTALTFSGRVEVDVEVSVPVSEVRLNAAELTITSASIFAGALTRAAIEHRLDDTYEILTLVFADALPVGRATLTIAFEGVLNDQLRGFYRSTFEDEAGGIHTIATTQFEDTDARRAFPCFDEPDFKATFEVTLTIPSHLAAYANSPIVVETDLGDGWRELRFGRTMIMSTYLVAFVVGPFEETAALDVDGVPLRVVYLPGKGHLAAFGLEMGAFALRFFADYFAIPYPGEKLDLVAIPDFAAGAMENLGCATFRDAYLLVDPADASIAELKDVIQIVAHEIAHMWFGDLVTMAWWEGIWLNEAFATFSQMLCANAFRPEWQQWIDMAASVSGRSRDGALRVDGLHHTRAIEYEVISPADTRGMFDTLTYEKGASVLRMLEQYLGETTFRDGIRHYLKQHRYANTVTSDLWDALEEVSGQPVRAMMDTWILQGGHPLVTLHDATIAQSPFSYAAPSGDSAIGHDWLVPVLTRSLDGGSPTRHLLAATPLAVHDAAPIVLNAGGSGVFRSRYDDEAFSVLASRVRDLEPLERATFVADAWALLFSNRLTWSAFYDLATNLGDLEAPEAWAVVAGACDFAMRATTGAQRERLQETIRALFTPNYQRLGWDAHAGESEQAPQLRTIVLEALGGSGHDEAVRTEALRRYDGGDIDASIAKSVIGLVAQQDRPGDYEDYLERVRHPASPQEYERYAFAGLGQFGEEASAMDAFERCRDGFRTQDAPVTLAHLSSNYRNGPLIWRQIAAHWDELLAKFPVPLHTTLTVGITSFINDPDFADEVEAFHLSHPIEGQQRWVLQHIERMHIGVGFASAIRAQL